VLTSTSEVQTSAAKNTGTFKKKLKTYLFHKFFKYNSLLNLYYVVLVVIGLVGHCCKPGPSVIIIIILSLTLCFFAMYINQHCI